MVCSVQVARRRYHHRLVFWDALRSLVHRSVGAGSSSLISTRLLLFFLFYSQLSWQKMKKTEKNDVDCTEIKGKK